MSTRSLTIPTCAHGQHVGRIDDIEFICAQCTTMQSNATLLQGVLTELTTKFTPNLEKIVSDLQPIKKYFSA